MIRIKIPATSANLGVGFDSLGISISLFNVFEIKESKNYKLIGFSSEYNNDNNLVLLAYKAFCNEYANNNFIKISINIIKNDIPVSRGLGSSASCIVAGVFAANEINNLKQSFTTCVEFASKLEGHPDNVFPSIYGGLVAVYLDENHYFHENLIVSEQLDFHLLIPNVLGNTNELRNSLPNEVNYKDIVYNLSRAIHLQKAFEDGNFETLTRLLKDRLHEDYRYPSIPLYKEIKDLKSDNLIVVISGSGPSVLLISKKNTSINISSSILSTFKLLKVEIGSKLEIDQGETFDRIDGDINEKI